MGATRQGLLLAATVLMTLAGCECGPGKPCTGNADCGAGLRCETGSGASGYCIVNTTVITNDGGAPVAQISNAPVDFGPVSCGRGAVMKTIDLTNGGTAAFTFSAALSGSPSFTFSGATSGTVEPGQTVKLSISATAASSATAGIAQQGGVTLTTNDPALPKVDVPLTMVAAGVTLTLAPAIASFGLVPVGSNAPAIPLSLTNLGNVPATVKVMPPADAQFSVTYTGMPADLTIAPGMGAAGLTAGFKPTKSTPSSSQAKLVVTEAVCGMPLPEIPLTGQGTNGSVGISTSDLFFGANGRVSCGTTASARTFTLTNSGNAPYSWTAMLAKGAGSPFTVMPSSGTVPANTGSVTITLTPAAIPAMASTAEEAYGDTLSVVTDAANDSAHPITLHQTASGAVLSFAPSSVDFGTVPINKTATAPLSVVNEGNAAATVSLMSSGSGFSLTPTGTLGIGASSVGSFTGTFAPGTSTTPQMATVTLSVDGGDVLCAPLPAPAALSGLGTNGSVSYSPVALDFGSVNCGTTALPKTVTFNNAGNQDYVVSASLAKGAASGFTVSLSNDAGVVAQDGGMLVITVTPKMIPTMSAVTANLYGDTLTVTSDVPGDAPHAIPLRETARGSIFGISTPSVTFGSVAVGVTGSSQITLTNTGNAPGTLLLAATQPTIFSVPASVALSANGSSNENATFTPMAATPYSDLVGVTVAMGTVLCQPLSTASISLSGTGTSSNVVQLSASTLNFGKVSCGAQAVAQNVTVTNNSNQTLTLTPTFVGGASTAYTVTGPATLAVGAMGTLTVTPKMIPTTSSTATDGFSSALSVKATGTTVDETHVVTLRQTAEGAILTFNPTTLAFKASVFASVTNTFTVSNTGNLNAPYSLSIGGADPGNFSVSPMSAAVDTNMSTSETVTYSSPLAGSRTATLSIATSVVRCGPIPMPITLNGAP